MPIDPRALEDFLHRPAPMLPQFKGAPPDKLRRLIYDSTGCVFSEKTTSRYYQLEGTAFALYKRRALLFYWMRLGKTKIGLDWATHLRRARLARGKGLIIAHGPLGVDVWCAQAAVHSDLHVRPIYSGPDAGQQLADAVDTANNVDMVAISWPTLQQLFAVKRPNRKGKPTLYPDIELLRVAAGCFSHVVIDETHFCMDHGSLRFAIGAELVAECKQRLGLTGTPIGRNPFAIWPQAFLIDDGAALSRSYYFFEAAFGKTRKNPFTRSKEEIVFDKTKMDLLSQKLAGFTLSYGKGEVRSAEVFAGVIELQMSSEQKTAYNEVVDKLVHVGNDEVEIDAIFTRLRQIASGWLPFVDAAGERRIVHFANSAKLTWLREFLEELPPDVQAIIFHEYVHSGELICQALAKAKISHAWIYGGTVDRATEVAKFQSGKAQVLVANAKTGGTSIDLPQADYLCFFESPTSPISREQAQARPMARELDRPLLLDDLVCAPVEAKILGFIKEGRDLLQALVRSRRLGNILRAN